MPRTGEAILPSKGRVPTSGHSPASRRWTVWQLQAKQGHRPCFATPERFFCTENGCPFLGECRQLRAGWRH